MPGAREWVIRSRLTMPGSGLAPTPVRRTESVVGTSCEIERKAPGDQVGPGEVSQNDAPVQGVQAPPNAGSVTIVEEPSLRSTTLRMAVIGHPLDASGQFQMATDTARRRPLDSQRWPIPRVMIGPGGNARRAPSSLLLGCGVIRDPARTRKPAFANRPSKGCARPGTTNPEMIDE